MRNNVSAAREIAQAMGAEYAAALWADVPILTGQDGPYVTFPGIVGSAIVGREGALSPARRDLRRFQPPDFDGVAVAVLAAWFLDYGYFRFSLGQIPVAFLFGTDPVAVSEEMVSRLSVSAAQFLCGYEEEDRDKRQRAANLAALAIKESMWGGPLPEEWI
ncbi:MAG TPA: hypothetical protein VID75_02115 [Acidimicrobiales bacterium]